MVTGKDLIELLPIDENLSDGNSRKDPTQHAHILPNVRVPTDIHCHIRYVHPISKIPLQALKCMINLRIWK